jgi:hypothetical protein
MRWTAWSVGHPGWCYAPFQYFSVEARYAHDLLAPTGKLSWLKRLLNEYEVEALKSLVRRHGRVLAPGRADLVLAGVTALRVLAVPG